MENIHIPTQDKCCLAMHSQITLAICFSRQNTRDFHFGVRSPFLKPQGVDCPSFFFDEDALFRTLRRDCFLSPAVQCMANADGESTAIANSFVRILP